MRFVAECNLVKAPNSVESCRFCTRDFIWGEVIAWWSNEGQLICQWHCQTCRQHEERVIVTAEDDAEDVQQLAAGRWDGFWGYDLIHNKGLLDSIYARLQIKHHAWPGLKELPHVRTYIQKLMVPLKWCCLYWWWKNFVDFGSNDVR